VNARGRAKSEQHGRTEDRQLGAGGVPLAQKSQIKQRQLGLRFFFNKNILWQNSHGQQIFIQEGTGLLILLSMQINTEKNSSCTSPTAHKNRERTKAELSTIDKQKSFREKSRPTSALLGKLPVERIRPDANY
jgi:hypothetical protein